MKGFTLLELLIAIGALAVIFAVIIGIIVAVMM